MNRPRIISFFIIFVLCLPVFAADQASVFYPGARVRDISDRAYEPAVIELLDGAKKSIVISMYVVRARDKGPVSLLIKDLEEALDRGVAVEIYINTRPGYGMPKDGDIGRMFKLLTDKGARVYQFTPYYMLHDKLIIVDDRYVVDGSTNWSVAALKSNYESATLIDSPELAKAKLIRLKRFPLEGYKKEKKRPDRPKGFEPLPDDAIVGVSKELMTDKGYFPAMLKRQAHRTMDIYLMLLAESARLDKKEFFIPLEEIAVTAGMSPVWSDTELRRQAIKELRALQDKYKLINVNFSYGKDAWVALKDLQGEVFNVRGDFFDPKKLFSKSHPAKFMALVKALLDSEGSSVDSVPVSAISGRFGISEFSVRKGMKAAQHSP